MLINIIAFGKIKEKYIIDGIDEFKKRITSYSEFKIIELKEDGNDFDIKRAMQTEEERLFELLKKEPGYNILLDLRGKSFDSVGFSEHLSELMNRGNSKFNFIIGGSYGVTEAVRSRSDMMLRFSEFTFPHQLMRLILCEQVYRWLSILGNSKYHK